MTRSNEVEVYGLSLKYCETKKNTILYIQAFVSQLPIVLDFGDENPPGLNTDSTVVTGHHDEESSTTIAAGHRRSLPSNNS